MKIVGCVPVAQWIACWTSNPKAIGREFHQQEMDSTKMKEKNIAERGFWSISFWGSEEIVFLYVNEARGGDEDGESRIKEERRRHSVTVSSRKAYVSSG
ncbi:hypothetical protein TNCV_1117941 [Trichonephila clavipes]|nr:hypothetical protein TNCV_1117941 [Trichonephila clavipes]